MSTKPGPHVATASAPPTAPTATIATVMTLLLLLVVILLWYVVVGYTVGVVIVLLSCGGAMSRWWCFDGTAGVVMIDGLYLGSFPMHLPCQTIYERPNDKSSISAHNNKVKNMHQHVHQPNPARATSAR